MISLKTSHTESKHLLLIFRAKKPKDFNKDEIGVLISLYYEFFIDENIGGKSKEFKTLISSNSQSLFY